MTTDNEGNSSGEAGKKPTPKESVGGERPSALAKWLLEQSAFEAAMKSTDRDTNYYKLALDRFATSKFLDDLKSRDALKEEISKLRADRSEKTSALRDSETSKAEVQKRLSDILEINEELRKKEDLRHLLDRVHVSAQKLLIEDEAFRARLTAGEECDAFVMSVDIRRSTELMLKAREPARFAEFITGLSEELFSAVIDNNGVFDKFTGDGILAFFPTEFTGKDSGYFAMRCAAQCHRIFDKVYRSSRRSFSSVLKGVGLGIGVDFGRVRLLKVAEGLTVVGAPVVYACRLSGAPAGKTYVNQPAIDLLEDNYRKHLSIEERSMEIKHEGEIIAYQVAPNHLNYQPSDPDWRDR